MFSRVVIAGLIASAPALAAADSLRFGHIQAPGSPAAMGAQKLADLAEEYSGGDLTIRIYPSAQLGDVRNLVGSVKTGALDMAEGTFPLLADVVPEYNVYNAGYFYSDWSQLDRIVHGEEFGQVWDTRLAEETGMQIIGAFYYGSRNLTTNGVAAKSPADLGGRKIRSVPNEMSLAVVTGLGAQPTPVPFADLFQALSQGVVDGQENPLPTIMAEKFYEVQDTLVLTNHQLIALPWIINDRAFEGLTPENQDALLKAATEAAEYATNLTIEEEKTLAERLEAEGMTVVTVEDGIDDAAFRSAVQAEVETRFEGKIWPEGLSDQVRQALGTDGS